MSINALQVSTLKIQMWHNYWKASIKEQNQIIFDDTILMKKDVYCQQRRRRLSFGYIVWTKDPLKAAAFVSE